MATRKPKADGIEALVRQDPISIQDITMLDWYAAFALLKAFQHDKLENTAAEVFDVAEAMMKERERRM